MDKKCSSLLIVLTLMIVLLNEGMASARGNNEGEFTTVTRSMSLEKIEESKETCIQCHSKVSPRVVAEYKSGAHMKAGLNCETCHGKNHRIMPLVTGKKVCSKCHEQETKEMMNSKHSQSWRKMWDNSRYWSQSKAMRQQGCSRCHNISYGFNDVRCDYCHTTHEFSVKEAKEPSACTTCHMGPDHPQAEAYEESAHGQLFKKGDNEHKVGSALPTCVNCHQANGDHNVSNNIGIGGVSNGGAMADWEWMMDADGKPKLKRTIVSNQDFQKARNGNVLICNQCHNSQFNQQWLYGADQVKVLVDQQLLQAEEIINELYKEGLIYPNPKTRPGNPIEGQKLVLGGNQLYTGTSKVEAIYFQMYKFAAVQSWKSAYHQNFQRAGNNGIKEMQRLMGELQDEAELLRLLGPINVDKNGGLQADKIKVKSHSKYWLDIVVGLVLGILLSVYSYIKRKKGKFIGSIFVISIFLGLFYGENKVLAWDGQSKEQDKCVVCHEKQSKELRIGGHSELSCLNCHELGSKLNQVRKPETCGKCHNGDDKGFELETYMSSPHGIQYKTKGINKWVPTCATCHMPGGIHNPQAKLMNTKNETKGNIGEVCLRCHITDDVIKFSDDKSTIYKLSDTMSQELKAVGIDLIAKGILISGMNDETTGVEELKKRWGSKNNWTLVNINNLAPEEQIIADKLVNQLVQKTIDGITLFDPKMRIGTAHVNPDYAHWYGNAYLNLALSEVKNTAIELEALAKKAGYSPDSNISKPYFDNLWGILIISATALSVYYGINYFYRKIRKN